MKRKILLAISIVFTFVSCILIYRFFSWGFIISPILFLNSFKIPSFIIFAISLAVIFIDKEKIIKIFRLKIVSILSNRLIFKIFNVFSILFFISSLLITSYMTPPEWKRFIDVDFLSGAQTEFSKAEKSIQYIEGITDSETETILHQCINVFKIREQLNQSYIDVDVNELKKNITFLSRTNANNYIWPLMQFSVAEGMSILKKYDMALSYYDSFLLNPNKYLTEKWIQSANMNKGNIDFYKGNFSAAIDSWKVLPKEPALLANMAAAYCMIGKFNLGLDCIDEGFKLLTPNLEQNYNVFNSLVYNKIIIYTANDMIKDAMSTYYTANDLSPFDNELNSEMCLLLILNSQLEEAFLLIDKLYIEKSIPEYKYNLFKGLYFVAMDNKEAMKFLHLAFSLESRYSIDQIYKIVSDFFNNNGYQNSKKIKSLLDKIKTLPNN